jgi:hypothetical protein
VRGAPSILGTGHHLAQRIGEGDAAQAPANGCAPGITLQCSGPRQACVLKQRRGSAQPRSCEVDERHLFVRVDEGSGEREGPPARAEVREGAPTGRLVPKEPVREEEGPRAVDDPPDRVEVHRITPT